LDSFDYYRVPLLALVNMPTNIKAYKNQRFHSVSLSETSKKPSASIFIIYCSFTKLHPFVLQPIARTQQSHLPKR
jgi:hypothetical protein